MQVRKLREISLALLLVVIAILPTAEAIDVSKLRGGIPHEALLSVAFDGNRGLAGGVGGALMSTEDGGRTWKGETSPTSVSVTAVAIRGTRRLIAGQMGEIFFDDGAGKWQKSESGTKERLLGAAINSSGVGLIVGSFGVFIRSEDGGKTWQQLPTNWDPLFAEAPDLGEGFQPQLYGVYLNDDGAALVVGEFETIVRSEDAGLTWRTAMVGDVMGRDRPPTLFAVNMGRDGRAYAVGQSGVIMASEDHGKNWCKLNSGTEANLFDVASLNNGEVIVSGMRRMLLGGGGKGEWTVVDGEDLSTSWYSEISANADGDVIAVGQMGSILKISN